MVLLIVIGIILVHAFLYVFPYPPYLVVVNLYNSSHVAFISKDAIHTIH